MAADTIEPTAERRRHGTLTLQQAAVYGPGGGVVGRSTHYRDRATLALLRIAREHPADITPRMVAAGMQLREQWELAGVEPRQTGAYSPLGAGGDDDDVPIARTRAVGDALAAIGLVSVRAVVEYVVIHDLPDSRIALLRIGLSQLARHYKIDA